MFIYEFMSGVTETLQSAEDEEVKLERKSEAPAAPSTRAPYDPHKHRDVEKPTSYFETMTHMLKGSIGAGVLAMPQAFAMMGLVVGAIGLLIVGALATYCLHLLIAGQYEMCIRLRRGYVSYNRSVRESLATAGPTWMKKISRGTGQFVDYVLLIWQLGLCGVYIVFVAENLKDVVDYHSEVSRGLSLRIFICCLLPALFLVTQLRTLKVLAPMSSASNIIMLMGYIIVFYYLFENDLYVTSEHVFPNIKMESIPVFIGITLFALEAVGVVLALEYNMEEPKRFRGWFGLMNIAMTVILMFYLVVGVFGFLKYGQATKAALTLNLPPGEKKAQAARLIIGLGIFLTYPLQSFVAYNILMHKVQLYINPSKQKLFGILLRIFIVIIPWSFAVASPQLGPYISLVGAFCLSILAVILPAIQDFCLYWPKEHGRPIPKLIKDVILIIIGIFCLCSGVYTSVLDMVQGEKEAEKKMLQIQRSRQLVFDYEELVTDKQIPLY